MNISTKISLNNNKIQSIESFSVAMMDNHRNHRSGGQLHRSEKQIYIDAKRGKAAEFILYNFLKTNGLRVSNKPNLNIYPLSEWDSGFDLEVITSRDYKWRIDVKASSPRAHNLLLERKDWSLSNDGKRVIKNSSNLVPSFWFAVNVDSDMTTGTIKGCMPQKFLMNAMLDSSNSPTLFQGDNIPDTAMPLDADNYIWKYEELWEPMRFIKYYRDN